MHSVPRHGAESRPLATPGDTIMSSRSVTTATIDLHKVANSNTYAEMEPDHRGFARFGYIAIAVVFGGFGLWATLAPLDSAAVAHAKVAAEGDRKPVQHLEGGIVREILVKEAQRVSEGQVLFRLQPTAAQASSDTLAKAIDMAMAQEARLMAESNNEAKISFPTELLARRSIPETAMAIADQTKQFSERRRSLESQTGVFRNRIEQTTKDMAGRKSRLEASKLMHKSIVEELALLEPLKAKGLTTNARILPQQRQKLQLEGDMGQLEADLGKLAETIEESSIQIRLAEQRLREEAQGQLAEVRGKLSELREKAGVARDVLARVEVRAPRDGIVQGIKVQSIGGVVKPGEAMAEVIPVDDLLVLSAQVSPMDIDSVHAGQKTEIKFPAFSRHTTPTIHGKLVSVSADSFMDEVSKQSFYRAKVVIEQGAIPDDLRRKLVPGMPADVLIIRGERTALTYLISPLRDAIWKTMRDR
jgi:HlyD family secretion protein